jgi:hypothetical protein
MRQLVAASLSPEAIRNGAYKVHAAAETVNYIPKGSHFVIHSKVMHSIVTGASTGPSR